MSGVLSKTTICVILIDLCVRFSFYINLTFKSIEVIQKYKLPIVILFFDHEKGNSKMAEVNLDPFNLKMDYKIWFQKFTDGESKSLIGEKKIELLNAIHKLGSIKSAAEKCELDFKVAWDMINSANERFAPRDLVVSTRGRGGGSYLSPLGLEILQKYERMNSIIKSILPKILDGYIADVVDVKQNNSNNASVNLQLRLDKKAEESNIAEIFENSVTIFVIPLDKNE